MRWLRPDRLVLALVLLSPAGASLAEVQIGLERVEAMAGAPLQGKRIGLLVHAASVTRDGRRAVDVLRGQGVRVVRLFTPEHGLEGRAAAGSEVAGGRDASTGLPIVSLYGPRDRPSRGDLEGLDVLVVDLQDAGVRFYTYAATMLLAIEAASDAGLEAVVLDRPNPLGGDDVEGPEADLPRSERGLLNLLPGPLVHGLTLGEMARLAAASRSVRVTVVPMAGWSRRMRWRDTGRPWTPPSPNLRTADAALVYAGTALLEATNVTEGRGTEAPFLLFGAPWLKPANTLAKVEAAGLRLEAVSFTPRSSEAAPHPKYDGQRCEGARIVVTDAGAVRPYAFGLSLLAALRSTPDFRWGADGRQIDTLLGTRRVREALERGVPVPEVLERDSAALTRFRDEVKGLLLY